jgi:hypothetical protein
MEKNKQIAYKITKKLKEVSATGTGASFTPGSGEQIATPFAFNPNKKASGSQGAKYSYKLGYKLAPKQPMDETNPGASLGKGPSAGKSGVKNSYYTKMGFKNVNPKELASKAKWVDTKYLWEDDSNIEEYIDTLNIKSPKLKEFISSRISGFDKIEDKLNELLPLLQKAKQKTMDEYKQNPSFAVMYGTDLAVDYLNDLIEMFKD